MKRYRLWWCAGALVLSVMAVAVGLWGGPSSGAPRVSLTLVGWTNSRELVSTNEFAPASAHRPKRLALVRIANEDSVRYSVGGMLSEEFYYRGGHPVKQRVEMFLSRDSRLVNVLEAGASITVPISVGDDGLPWQVDFFCFREARHAGFVRFLTPHVPLKWIKWGMEKFPPYKQVDVYLRSETNATKVIDQP